MAAADVIVKSETFLDSEISFGDASLLDNHSGYNIYDTEENDDNKMHELLRDFDLEILYTILKIGDITFRSLKYISENDINEAIRSIAYRAEFREKLFAWRRDKFGFNDLSILPPSNANDTQVHSSDVPTNFSNLNKNTTVLDFTTESNKNQGTPYTRSMSTTTPEMPAAKIRKISATRTITTPAATITPRSSPSHSITNPPFKETSMTNLPSESTSPTLTFLPSTSVSTDQSMDNIAPYSLQPTTSAQAKALASAATAVDVATVLTPPTATTTVLSKLVANMGPPRLSALPKQKDLSSSITVVEDTVPAKRCRTTKNYSVMFSRKTPANTTTTGANHDNDNLSVQSILPANDSHMIANTATSTISYSSADNANDTINFETKMRKMREELVETTKKVHEMHDVLMKGRIFGVLVKNGPKMPQLQFEPIDTDVDAKMLENHLENSEYEEALGIHPGKKDSLNFLKRMQSSGSNFIFDLKSLLEEHPLGRALYRNGTSQKKLISLHRSMLCDIIIWKLLKTNRSVTNSDYLEIATQIVHLFPEECIETYYVAPVKKANSKLNISEVAKGKLPDKFRNLRAVIRGAERIGTPSTINNEHKKHSEEYVTAEKSQLWLLHNREVTEVRHHWNISYILRESDVKEKKYTNVENIFSMWPILKESKGFELIEQDFVKKFPNCEDLFMLKWDDFFPRLLTLYQKKLSEQDLIYRNILEDDMLAGNDMKLHPDSKTGIQFYLLASLMAPKANKVVLKSKDYDCKATFWKPTIAESREGIILQVAVPEDIQRAINEKKNRMLRMGLPLQPLVVIIGTGPTDIKKAYVWIDSITYELPSLLKAIDVLLKFYLVFNLPYPLECENYCYLIQWGLYNIRTKSDTQIPFVYNTLNMLKNQNT